MSGRLRTEASEATELLKNIARRVWPMIKMELLRIPGVRSFFFLCIRLSLTVLIRPLAPPKTHRVTGLTVRSIKRSGIRLAHSLLPSNGGGGTLTTHPIKMSTGEKWIVLLETKPRQTDPPEGTARNLNQSLSKQDQNSRLGVPKRPTKIRGAELRYYYLISKFMDPMSSETA